MQTKLEPLLEKAKEQEKKYNWLRAADSYEQASSLVPQDSIKVAELRERIGYCFFRAAFQAKTNEQFRSIMKQSVEAYEKTVGLNQKTKEEDTEAKIFHAKAMVAYASGRLTSNITQRRMLLDEWFNFENKALKVYEKTGDPLFIGRTYNNLAEGSMERQLLESRWLELKKSMIECISYGEKAIKALSQVENEYELARAYTWIVYHLGIAFHFKAIDTTDEHVRQNLFRYITKALELSEKIGAAYLQSITAISKARTENPAGLLEGFRNVVKYGSIAKDNYWMGYGNAFLCGCLLYSIKEDPNKQREEFKEALKIAQDAIRQLSIIDDYSVRFTAYNASVMTRNALAELEPDFEKKHSLLETAVEEGRKNLRNIEDETVWYSVVLFLAFSNALFALSEIETNVDNKRQLLQEALIYREKQLDAIQSTSPLDYWVYSMGYTAHALTLVELAKMEKGKKRNGLFKKAVLSMEKCVQLIEKDKLETQMGYITVQYGLTYYSFGGILEQVYSLTSDKKLLYTAIEAYKGAIRHFNKMDLKTRMAESYWQIARLKNHLGDNLESASSYLTASENYALAAEKHPKLEEFYRHHTQYMKAWSEIENAKHNHKIEDYSQSKGHYEKAAKLHESSKFWSYLAPNYLAWAQMEKAENHSRKDEHQEALIAFKKAIEQFNRAKVSIQSKLKTLQAADEKMMVTKLITSSNIRQRYCQARISIEEAKIFDRNGRYSQSSRSYGLAAEKLTQIIEETEHKQTQKELKMILILSQAWQKMAQAEEKTSSDLYLQAAQLFEQANEFSLTKKASLLALGNSSFCKGLAAGTRFQNTLDVKMHSEAKGQIKSAATYYLKAGFKTASEYAKATQRLLDAYLYMNNAERETDPEKSAKYYKMAEKVLQVSAESFTEARQPEKKAEVERILGTVKEERELAVSLNEVLHAPTVASTAGAFTTLTPTSEESVGLERFEHADVQANLIAGARKVRIRESFHLSIEFINAGKEPALLLRVEDFVPSGFVVVKKPEIYRLEESCLNMKGKQLSPLKLVEVKLTLQASKEGEYQLNPKVHYLDERGQNKSLQLKTLEIKVEEVVLADRVSTGTHELDSLLLGGIPKECAIVLTGPPSDDRDYLIKNFLEAGTKEDETVFYVATEADGLKNLLKDPDFHLFLCNPKPKTQVPDLPNVYKLRSKTDLTNLSISLAKAYRNIESSKKKRICVENISDVIVDYETKATRKWISELITDLGSKGFTLLAVVNSLMHASEELHAVLDLFDGEINITQNEDPLECKKSILVKKLRNQDYIKNPICLT